MNHTILQMLRDAQPSVFQKVASYTLPEDIPMVICQVIKYSLKMRISKKHRN